MKCPYIKIPVVGIPNWPWKKNLVKYSCEHPKIFVLDIKYLCYGCQTHLELLKMFDKENQEYSKTKYFLYQTKKKGVNEKSAISKINNFKEFYRIFKKGKKVSGYITITIDGCRLDGSHRLSMLSHLGTEKAEVNIAFYEDLFKKDQIEKIRKQVLLFRKKEHGFE